MNSPSGRKLPASSPSPGPGDSGDGRKRTIAITLLALGAGAVTIGTFSGAGTGSRDRPRTYKDVATCEAEKIIPSNECRQNFMQAISSHERSAPGFAAREACEKEYGASNCLNPSQASGRASLFIPIMAGYLIGQRAGGGFQSAPLYRRPGDPADEYRQSAAFPYAASSGSSSSSGSRSGSWAWGGSSSGSSSGSAAPASSSSSSAVTTTSRGGFGSSSHGSSGT